MKKFKTALLIIIAMIGFVTISNLNNTTAQAAAWHKGIPKVLRGKWRVKHVSTKVDRLKVTKKRVYLYSAGPFHLKNIKYKKTGTRSYKVRGYEYTYLHAKTTISFKKIKGHKIIKYKGNYPGASWTKYIPR